MAGELSVRAPVAVMSIIPRLAESLRAAVPSLRFEEVKLGSKKTAWSKPFKGLHGAITEESLPILKQAEVIVADYHLLAPFMYELPKARWVQATWAGADPIFKVYDPSKPPPQFTITRFSGDFFGGQMAEYVIANIVNRERLFHSFWQAQKEKHWAKTNLFPLYRNIQDLTVTILGLGTIGDKIAEVLHLLGARIWGVGRSERTSLPPYIQEYRTLSGGLAEALAAADYIVNVLPETPATAALLGGEALRVCAPRKAVLMNIGRGSIVPEADLVRALREGWLGGAVLDVFEKEPLPPESPLWTEPGVDLTPHVAGISRPQDVAAHFRNNLERYLKGEPLLVPLDLERGY